MITLDIEIPQYFDISLSCDPFWSISYHFAAFSKQSSPHNSQCTFFILASYFLLNSGLFIRVDLPCFHSPSIITGDTFNPDLILDIAADEQIYIFGLTVGFETNLEVNAEHKRAQFQSLVENFKSQRMVSLSLLLSVPLELLAFLTPFSLIYAIL